MITVFISLNTLLKISNNLYLILIQQLILISPIIYFIKIKRIISLENLGFVKINILKAVYSTILALLAFIFISGIVTSFQEALNISIPGFGTQMSYAPIFENLNIVTIIIVAAIIVPIVEELLFRGLIFHQIKSSMTNKILVSAVLFSLFHMQFEVFIPLTILGIIIGYLRVTQNSIYVPIIFHITNNSLAIYVNFFLLAS
jgi:membrane protease YdiL (CAAX protease family)